MADGTATRSTTDSSPASELAARIDALQAKQRSFFRSGKTRRREFRETQLGLLLHAVERHEQRLCEALAHDLHRSRELAYVTEIGLIREEIKLAVRNLGKWMKPRTSVAPLALAPALSTLVAQPLGLNLVIAPWNYPVQLAIIPLIGAIAAGNVAVVKPSEVSSATSKAVAELIADTFDEEYVAVLEGGVDVSQALLERRWDHIFFTGGTEVGRIVAQAGAKHLSRVTLELGGKSPTIVTRSANLAVAARRIVMGKFINAGQTCIAPDYVLAERSVHDGLLSRMSEAIEEFFGADPKRAADYGRIINDRHFERLAGLIDSEKVAAGGQTDASERYIAPTILRDVTMDDPIMQSEIFGPVLPVLKVDSLDEAIQRIDAHPNPLALYLFTRDKAEEQQVMSSVSFGGGCINNCMMHYGDPSLPFGGIGESGVGAYHGEHSFQTFSHMKGVLRSQTLIDPSLTYPPYQKKMGIIRRLLG